MAACTGTLGQGREDVDPAACTSSQVDDRYHLVPNPPDSLPLAGGPGGGVAGRPGMEVQSAALPHGRFQAVPARPTASSKEEITARGCWSPVNLSVTNRPAPSPAAKSQTSQPRVLGHGRLLAAMRSVRASSTSSAGARCGAGVAATKRTRTRAAAGSRLKNLIRADRVEDGHPGGEKKPDLHAVNGQQNGHWSRVLRLFLIQGPELYAAHTYQLGVGTADLDSWPGSPRGASSSDPRGAPSRS